MRFDRDKLWYLIYVGIGTLAVFLFMNNPAHGVVGVDCPPDEYCIQDTAEPTSEGSGLMTRGWELFKGFFDWAHDLTVFGILGIANATGNDIDHTTVEVIGLVVGVIATAVTIVSRARDILKVLIVVGLIVVIIIFIGPAVWNQF